MSTLPLTDSASLLPCESRNPNCPLPIHTPMGGGGAGASSAHPLRMGQRTSAVVAMTRTIVMMLLMAIYFWRLIHGRRAYAGTAYALCAGTRDLKCAWPAGRESPREALPTWPAARAAPVRQEAAS